MKKLSFGIDIGGINTVTGLIDQEGNFCGESSISTKKYPHYNDYKSYVADLATAGDLIFKPTDRYLKENLCPALNSKVRLMESGNKDKNIAILGAASLIWKKCI